MSRFSLAALIIFFGYGMMVVVVVGALLVARGRELRSHNEIEQKKWKTWRDEVKRHENNGDSPVARRVPKSEEPPTLVLLRDYFGTSLTIILVLSSALYFTAALMVRGALGGPPFEPAIDDEG